MEELEREGGLAAGLQRAIAVVEVEVRVSVDGGVVRREKEVADNEEGKVEEDAVNLVGDDFPRPFELGGGADERGNGERCELRE